MRQKKNKIRTNFKKIKNKNSNCGKIDSDRKICSFILDFILKNQSAKLLGAFIPNGHEPKILPALKKLARLDYTIAFPKFDRKRKIYKLFKVETMQNPSFENGKFGIPEPNKSSIQMSKSEMKKTAILIPGLAFDLEGGRLGHGFAYYDKVLSESHGFKVGIAYSDNIIEKLPQENHDIQMTHIITEKNIYECKQKQLSNF